MRNARNCGCSFNQDQNTSCYGGERIRVNQGCSRCENESNYRDLGRGGCQDTCRPKPCPPRPCPPRPCPPRPCPPKPCPPKPCPPRPCPICDDRENSQPYNGRNNSWDEDCDCHGKRPITRERIEDEYFEEDEDDK